jgi:hypothetical protein
VNDNKPIAVRYELKEGPTSRPARMSGRRGGGHGDNQRVQHIEDVAGLVDEFLKVYGLVVSGRILLYE